MSQVATAWRLTAVAALAAVAVSAQTSRPAPGLNWRRLGLPSMNLHLAGAASGPVDSVWYSTTGGTLFLRTAAGAVFETADGENWSRTEASRPETPQPVSSVRLPEPRAQAISVSGDTRRSWALGRTLFVSEDGGATWTNLTGAESIIGTGQRDVAVNPEEPSALAVANDFGIWQSQDGGKSWAGLNDNLPNLPVSRIVSTSRGAFRVALDDGRVLQLETARDSWNPAPVGNLRSAEASEHQRIGRILGVEITASAHSGDLAYAGSADGRVWVSRDRGASWGLPQTVGLGSVQRLFVDNEAPRAALAAVALAGSGGRLVRTVNAGAVWDDVTGNLSGVAINAVTADRFAGIAYAATDRGIYMARVDMNTFSPPSAWTAISGALPVARAADIALDSSGAQLFVAIEGYGLYSALVPIHGGALRITNSADFSSRAAAPGSLISVNGAKISGARSGGLTFPVLAASDAESQLQIPFEASAQTLDLSLEFGASNSVVPLAIRNVSPAIFIDHDGSPLLVNSDSGLTVEPGSSSHPNARLMLMATGLGRVQPDWPTGVPAPAENPPTVTASVQAFLDGVPLEVSRATLAPGYVGYYVVEVQLPAILNAGPAELYLSADGQQSNKVRVLLDSQ